MSNKKILQFRYCIKKFLSSTAEKFTIPQKEYAELNEFSIKILQQLTHELIAKLKIDESSYRWLKNIGHNNARSFYLYSVVSEVLKASISNMRTLEFIRDSMEEEKYYPKARKKFSIQGELREAVEAKNVKANRRKENRSCASFNLSNRRVLWIYDRPAKKAV